MKRLVSYYNYHRELETYCDLISDKKHYNVDFLVKNTANINFKSDSISQLWTSTCFEVFEFDTKSNKYIEWNFNKELAYNIYFFKDYRKKGFCLKKLITKPIKMKALLKDNNFDYNLILPRFFKQSIIQINAVVKNNDGDIDYFALSHNPLKPDFHKVLPTFA